MRMYSIRERLVLYLKGVAMGAADVIPGVSGGTIAFISGIYQPFIGSLERLDHHTAGMLLRGRLARAWRYVNGAFLLTLAAGIFTAVLSLANVLQYLLRTYPVFLWAFFFGLIIASAWIVARKIDRWRAGLLVFTLVGTGSAYFVTASPVVQTPDTLPFVYMAGLISIMAMILPGISGSFLLVVLDKYNYVIGALSSIGQALHAALQELTAGQPGAAFSALGRADWMVLVFFYLGAMTGLIGFSKVLNWLFRRYYQPTIALLIGFMLGALNKVWPWKETVTTYTDRHGVEKPLLERNILPETLDAEVALAALLAFVGFGLVYGLERLASYHQRQAEASDTQTQYQ